MKRKSILVLVMLVSLLFILIVSMSIAASAEATGYSGTYGSNIVWNFNPESETLTISGSGYMEGDYGTQYPWIEYKDYITTLIIQEGINNIPGSAFYQFNALKYVTLSQGLKEIGDTAFAECNNLQSISIPNTVTHIGVQAFRDCFKLNCVDITDIGAWCNVTFTQRYASNSSNPLSNGANLYLNGTIVTHLIIPDNVSTISAYAFHGCKSILSITIPESVTYIGNSAFYECEKLVEVINYSTLSLESGNSSNGWVAAYAFDVHTEPSKIAKIGNYYFYTHNNTNYLLGCTDHTSNLILPSDFGGQNYEIYKYAFYKNSNTIVNIPEKIQNIGAYAFSNMGNLEKVFFNPIRCSGMSDSPFLESGSNGFDVEIGSRVATIPTALFENCNVASVAFAENSICADIGIYAFFGCDKLLSIVIPDSVHTIGYSAFESCSSLTSVTLGTSVTKIDYEAFLYCLQLVEVINRSSLYIGAGSQSNGFVSYYAINVHSSESMLINQNEYLFYDYGDGFLIRYLGEDTEIVLPSEFGGHNKYAIWNHAFSGNNIIKKVTIPESVSSIGTKAFASCDNLEYVVMANNIKNIGEAAFGYNSKLKEVTFVSTNSPDDLVISSKAFVYCDSLKKIEIPTNTCSIGSEAFYGCTSLKIVCVNSSDVTQVLNSFSACGYILSYAEVLLVTPSSNLDTFATIVFSYIEELNYEGTDYISYSLHTHAWEDCSVDRVQCEQDGFAGSKCSSCGLLKGNTSPSHNYTPHSANDEEYHWDVCADCGAIDNKIRHSWNSGEVTTPATHISTGVMTYTCGVCGRTYTETIEKIAEHNYGEWINTVQPGCSNTGTLAHYHCECGLDFDIDKNVLEDLTIPTRGHYVSQGGKEMVDSYIVQNDATYPFALSDSWYASSNRMDNTTSVFEIRATYDCTLVLKYKVSSESRYDKLIVLHNATTKDTISGSVSEKTLILTLKVGDVVYVKYTKDSSQSSGSDTGWFKIESCTQTEIDTTVYVPTDDVDPTCTDAVICESCHQTMKEALGHTDGEIVVENTVNPTCTAKGSYDNVVYCTVCDAELSRNTVEIPENGHTWGDWYETQAPTCTATGTDERECSVCHTKETRTTDANGHTNAEAVVENKVNSNCTTDGSYDSVIYCSVCNAEVNREAKVINKLGHDHSSEWTIDVDPTCTTVGSKSHHCSRCDDKADITEVAALGHSFTNYKSNNDATYTENGTETAKCDRCDVTDTRTDEDSALGLDQKFKDEMAALSKDANTETTYAELYSVLQTYATLSDTEKASVATQYATLQQLIENYNTKAQVANTELAEATEIAFAPIVATGFAFLAALWFLLKKKFFI